jgi:hypothetical protein
MSEVKLSFVDAQHIVTGTIHGSVADRCVAALSAEPETIPELEAALSRYMKPPDGLKPFACFRSHSEIDPEPWDAGLVIIDLAARIVATESSYSQPQPEGEVCYHDGTHPTDIAIPYRLPSDWLFVNSVEAYRWSSDRRRRQREANPPLDARAVLYATPLLEFIVNSVFDLDPQITVPSVLGSEVTGPAATSVFHLADQCSILKSEITDPEILAATQTVPGNLWCDDDPAIRAVSHAITTIHATWLLTPRDDLRRKSPRQAMLEKQDFIDFDLHTRCLQWTFQGEGPPCLAPDSFAYRFAGFGTHEWVVYYDLVRHLLWAALELRSAPGPGSAADRGSSPTVREGVISTSSNDVDTLVRKLEQIKTDWLENSNEYEGRVPAIIIDNERRRLPQAANATELLIDEDCECCRMLAREAEMGFGPTFWHLDGGNMDDGFAFSHYLTIEEWEAENQRYEALTREFEKERAERQQRIARGELIDEPSFSDAPF